jgi:dTDP-4-amino-4,6-dideoxygalactose transaminase
MHDHKTTLFKQCAENLALFGGNPVFTEKLHVGRPNIGNRDRFLSRVDQIFDSRWFTNNGPFVQAFEKQMCSFLGVKHCIPVCSGTLALEIAIRAMNLTGEVIVPSFSFVASAHALQWQNVTPVFCDIDPKTHCIDPEKVQQLITPHTSAILGVHVWGRPCNVEALQKIATAHKLKLLFDAAHAFGVSYRGTMLGNFGNAEVFSFHATKFFNTFEGGAIATNDDALADTVRRMLNFGFSDHDHAISIGTNGKMTEISAAMGITGMESLAEIISVNRQNYFEYLRYLKDVPGVQMIQYDESEKSNYQYVIAEIDPLIVGISRDHLIRALHAENILARRYFYPSCHQMEPYRSNFPHSNSLLPHTERLAQRVFSLPSGTSVGLREIQMICDVIAFILKNGREISEIIVSFDRALSCCD